MDYKNKVCVITGGAAGIGKCLVETFASLGAKVYYIDKDPVDDNLPENITGFQGDIAEEETLNRFADISLVKRRKSMSLSTMPVSQKEESSRNVPMMISYIYSVSVLRHLTGSPAASSPILPKEQVSSTFLLPGLSNRRPIQKVIRLPKVG